MSKAKKMITMSLIAIMVFAMSGIAAFASEDTASRGFQLVNGDVYDLSGNLLIKMDHGFTEDGYGLSSDFKVYTPIDMSSNRIARSTAIFSGTKALKLNVDGNQGRQLGANFTVSANEPNIECSYISGDPSGVNFAVVDITRGTTVAYIPNVQAGKSSGNLPIYNTSFPNDTYLVQASAQGSAGAGGNAYMQVVLK